MDLGNLRSGDATQSLVFYCASLVSEPETQINLKAVRSLEYLHSLLFLEKA